MITVASQSTQYAPLPPDAPEDQRVPLQLLRGLIREETVCNLRWACRLPDNRIALGMPQGCTLILPADPAALAAAAVPAFRLLTRGL